MHQDRLFIYNSLYMKRWWWFVGSAAGVLVLSGAGLFAFRPNHDDPSVNSPGGSVSLSDTPGHGAASTSLASQSVDPLTTVTPTPADFSQFDKYKSEQSAYAADLQAGTGAIAAAGKWLSVQYRGWLTNGTEFDESYARGKAFIFQMGAHSVIAGWEEGLNGMKVGGKRRLIVPPAVGYGAVAHGSIPANSLLVFDVELVAVGDTKPAQ